MSLMAVRVASVLLLAVVFVLAGQLVLILDGPDLVTATTGYFSFSYPATWEARENTLLVMDYAQYKSLKGRFAFQYPTAWDLESIPFAGGEILYHLSFKDPSGEANGFVQVWHIDKSLKQFIQEAQRSPVGIVNFKDFKVEEILVNSYPGYMMQYSRLGHDDRYYKAVEVFLKPGKEIYRISYFVPEKEWDREDKEIVETMIESFRILEY